MADDPAGDGPGGVPPLATLLERHRTALIAFLRREARGLLRFETEDDLVQGVHLRALHAQGFEYRGEAAFVAWQRTLAAQHVADRHDYWKALKRDAAHVLRITASTGGGGAAALDPPATATGPVTFAARRELVSIAMRAVAVLPERDRSLVRWTADGLGLYEMAARLGISYEAAERARLRAVDRFRKAFAALTRPGR